MKKQILNRRNDDRWQFDRSSKGYLPKFSKSHKGGTMRLRAFHILLIGAFLFSSLMGMYESKGADVSPNWIYYRVEALYDYLLRDTPLPDKQRTFFRERAYEFFFSYWVLHRSHYATLTPVPRFEKNFAPLLKEYACPYVDTNDPLGIKSDYKNGAYVPKPIPKIQGLDIIVPDDQRLPLAVGIPSERLKTWTGYQSLVSAFKTFLASLNRSRVGK